ncbi:MAG: hypothetical protein LBT23_02170 [Synergistaceae bacterium]|jgi:hypothetical protein|nr:hypothetical protein [Synergistaceae bacterium]
MATMTREQLRDHLHNLPLVQAIEQKKKIDTAKRRLVEALAIMGELGISEEAVDEMQNKYKEYQEISRGYGALIENLWDVSPWIELIVGRYTASNDDDIDRLPEIIE